MTKLCRKGPNSMIICSFYSNLNLMQAKPLAISAEVKSVKTEAEQNASPATRLLEKRRIMYEN